MIGGLMPISGLTGLLFTGGSTTSVCSDCWILNVHTKLWNKVSHYVPHGWCEPE